MITLDELPAALPRPAVDEWMIGRADDGRHYWPFGLLGEGAAGVVYACSGAADGGKAARPLYAMKVLCPLLYIARTDEGLQRIAKRFRAEALRGKHLRHPNLGEILATGKVVGGGSLWNGKPMYLMTLVKGTPLHTLFTQEPVSLNLRLRWIIDLGTALSYMHEQGALHRDVKPHNIIIKDLGGKLCLTDFGVVQWGDIAPHYTDGITTYSSEILTTWNYLPPEVESKPKDYDARAEAWSYGKTAMEILEWGTVPRAAVLTGSVGDEVCGSRSLRETVFSLVLSDPDKRMSIDEGVSGFSWALRCLEEPGKAEHYNTDYYFEKRHKRLKRSRPLTMDGMPEGFLRGWYRSSGK